MSLDYPAPGVQAPGPLTEQGLSSLLREEIPGLSAADFNQPFARLAIDSFGLLALRARLEQALGAPIPDSVWTALATPADLVRLVCPDAAEPRPPAAAGGAARRAYRLNMPQMAIGGLSESWLFKELGDVHWSMITDGLGAPSNALKDGAGERLYATFTRIRVESSAPLTRYAENEPVELAGRIARYGAGLFFSEVTLAGNAHGIAAQMMSSFSRRSANGSNETLLKGQPDIPARCAIPALEELPAFALQYRARRAAPIGAPLFETEYEIIPAYDINGVGLLYFAAYPMIADICAARHDRRLARTFSTRSRDVFYFANSNLDDTLVFRIHAWRERADGLDLEASLSRKSDGAALAYILTAKERADG